MRISAFCLKFNPKFETRQPFFPPYHKTLLCKCYDLLLFLPPGSFSSLLITIDYFPLLFSFLPSSFPLCLPSSPIPLSHFSPCLGAPGHSSGVSDPVWESHTWKYASRLFLKLVFFSGSDKGIHTDTNGWQQLSPVTSWDYASANYSQGVLCVSSSLCGIFSFLVWQHMVVQDTPWPHSHPQVSVTPG